MPFGTRLAKLNKRLLNPVMARLADRVRPLALVEHVGRRSGRTFTTPVFAFVHTDGGKDQALIALTYGPGVDWLANVEAAGGAAMIQRSHRYRSGPPQRIDADQARPRLPLVIRSALRVLQVNDFVLFDLTD